MLTNRLKRIIISRPDSIGDVALTLPIAGALKQLWPDVHIIFIGKAYTRAVIESCLHIDEFADYSSINSGDMAGLVTFLFGFHADAIIHIFPDKALCRAAFLARIPLRVATSGRWHTLLTCNRRVFFSRSRSQLHESQLNFKLLGSIAPFQMPELSSMVQLVGWKWLTTVKNEVPLKVIMHPKSQGSAPEWQLYKYRELAEIMDPRRFQIFITGTQLEREAIGETFNHLSNVTNLCGEFDLRGYISFLSSCAVMIASSTGPAHLAGLTGLKTIALFCKDRPFRSERWRPLGPDIHVLKGNRDPEGGLSISPDEVLQLLLRH